MPLCDATQNRCAWQQLVMKTRFMVLTFLLAGAAGCNAFKHTPAGGRITVEGRAREGSLEILVRDTGSGIPREQLETIFHPFYTTKETGTGLGLTLVHQMVVEHGGEITVESEVGRGSRFQVTLPGTRAELAATGT